MCLSWNTPDEWGAVLSAICVELPVAVVLGVAVTRMLGQSFLVVEQPRGHGPSKVPLWRQQVVIVPPQGRGRCCDPGDRDAR